MCASPIPNSQALSRNHIRICDHVTAYRLDFVSSTIHAHVLLLLRVARTLFEQMLLLVIRLAARRFGTPRRARVTRARLNNNIAGSVATLTRYDTYRRRKEGTRGIVNSFGNRLPLHALHSSFNGYPLKTAEERERERSWTRELFT